ncbi:MAG: protein TolQ [Thiomargarita sp.]|nr:protein TolQ [Thiomargarita sp.]
MNELSFIKLILEASLIVQIIMALLLLISVYSWSLIFLKSRVIKKAQLAANQFEKHFWQGKDLNGLYNRINSHNQEAFGMANIFTTGYMEFVKLRKQPKINSLDLIEGSTRAMRAILNREMEQLDRHLSTLATVGSVSPYIGLLGTVWGIMNSFHALGGMEQVALSMIAPGISEALIATAMGLFTAIPAVMAYNNYVDNVDRLINRYNIFLDEFAGILQRQSYVET